MPPSTVVSCFMCNAPTSPSEVDESAPRRRMPPLPTVRLPRPSLPTMSLPALPALPSIRSSSRFFGSGLASSDSSPQDLSLRRNQDQASELLVLAHGLQGTVEDFTYMLDELHGTEPGARGELLVHASSVNTDKTHDGIVAGGERLANDIREVVAKYPGLKRISLVGFSLGGLYVRYAIALLYDVESGRIAGLAPNKLVAVASPHLGVRGFGVYRFFPPPVLACAHLLFGHTGLELVLHDTNSVEHLLVSMSTDENPLGLPFISALKAFRQRLLYANVRNDFMVNYGTAALDHTVQAVGAGDVADIAVPPDGLTFEDIDVDYDEKGCKICFSFQYPSRSDQTITPTDPVAERAAGDEEELMCQRLKAVGWTVVAIDFPLAVPIAHNRIVAMSRGPVHSWLNAGGRRAVHHLVDTLVSGFEVSIPSFKQVSEPGFKRSLTKRLSLLE